MVTSDPNATATFSFSGSFAYWAFGPGPNSGSVDVYLDGASIGPADAQKGLYWSEGALTQGKHIMTFKPSAANALAGRDVELDFFAASNYPTLKAANGLIPDTSPALQYSGSPNIWTTMAAPRAYGGFGKGHLLSHLNIVL